jgi:Helicase conserved C-terminal domain
MSITTITFAEELRSRSDDQIAALFRLRPDLISPVPSDVSALAARAHSMPSLMRVRDSLNKWQIDILTAACTLAEPFALAAITSITSKAAEKAVESLWEIGLLYKEHDAYRIPTNVRTMIGEHPAGLGPASNKPINFNELKEAPKGAVELLQRLVWGPPKGQVADLKKAPPAISWLLEKNFLIPFDSQTLLLPREVAMYFRDGKVFKEIQSEQPQVTGISRKQKAVDQAAIANISTFTRWAEEVGHYWSDEPPTALRTGGLGVRDLKRTAEHLGVTESCAAFVAELLFIANLIVIDTNEQILPSSTFDIWLTRSIEEQWLTLVRHWLETSRVSGLVGKGESKSITALGPELDRSGLAALKKSVLGLLSSIPEIDPSPVDIKLAIKWLSPTRSNEDYIEWILRESEWLGITGQGAISTYAVAMINGKELGIEAALPRPVDHILIQADNSAIAPGPLTLELANSIGTIADIESRGGASVYRFSESSIRRGLDHGQTGDQIKDFLKKISKTAMPQPLEYLITDVAKRHGKLRIGHATSYLRCEDEGLIQELMYDKKLEDLRLRKLAPQVLISEVDSHELITQIREAGYLPAAENATGVLVAAPVQRRAKARPKSPPTVSDSPAPNPTLIASAVKALRAGERASSHKPREVVRTSANETLDLLHQFIQEQVSLTIGYADTNGGVSNRLIDPLSISLGTLVARDHATGELAHFRIPRITGVSPAN